MKAQMSAKILLAAALAAMTLTAGSATQVYAMPRGTNAPNPKAVVCKRECVQPAGLFMVCRNVWGGFISRRLIDVNRCIH